MNEMLPTESQVFDDESSRERKELMSWFECRFRRFPGTIRCECRYFFASQRECGLVYREGKVIHPDSSRD